MNEIIKFNELVEFDLHRIAQRLYEDKSIFQEILPFLLNPNLLCNEQKEETSRYNNDDIAICFNNRIEIDFENESDGILGLLRKSRKGKCPQATSELFSLLKQQSHDSAIHALMISLGKLSMSQQEDIVSLFLNLNKNKESEKVCIEVVKRNETDCNFRDCFNYCIYARNVRSKESRPIKFRNHASSAIYIMYLIDRHRRKGQATAIDINNNNVLFENIYKTVFNNWQKSPLLGISRSLKIDASGKYKTGKNRIFEFYSDINKTIKNQIADWDFVLPYRFDQDSFLSLNPNNIILPAELLIGEWSIK